MIPFGTTSRLILRPLQASDTPFLLTMINDLRIAQRTKTDDPRPFSHTLSPILLRVLEKAYVALIVQIKPDFLHLRGPDPEELVDPKETEEERTARRSFVGFCRLDRREPRNRQTELGIMLTVAWQSQGLGTEVLRWLLGYNFDVLGMHRMGLLVFGDNERARELYRFIGYVEEGKLREALWHQGRWVDLYLMSMLDREWQEKKKNVNELDLARFDDVVVKTLMNWDGETR